MKYLLFCIFIQLFSLNILAQTSAKETPTPPPPSETTANPANTSDALPVSPSKESQTSVANTPAQPAPRYVAKDAPVPIPRLETPTVIDGKLDDAVWNTAAVFGDFM